MRRLALTVLAICALAAPASAAGATGAYGPVAGPSSLRGGVDPQIARSSDGRTFLLARVEGGLRLATRRDAGSWTVRRLAPGPVSGALLVSDGSAVVAVWADAVGVRAIPVDQAGPIEEVAAGAVADLQAEPIPGGGIEVAWIVGGEVRSAHRVTGGWGVWPPIAIGPVGARLSGLRIAALPGGGAVAAVLADGAPYAAVRPLDGVPWAVSALAPGPVGDLALGVDSFGTAVVGFVDATASALLTTHATGLSWTAPHALAAAVNGLRIAAQPGGRMLIGYTDLTARQAIVVPRSAGVLGAPVALAPAPQGGARPVLRTLAFTASGDPLATLAIDAGSERGLQLVAGAVVTPVLLTADAAGVALAAGPDALLGAIADDRGIELVGADVVAPTLTVIVPRTVAAGVLTTYSARARDDGSGLAPTRWSFAGRAGPTGASVRFVLPRPGRFTVETTAVDLAGNTQVVRSVVTVIAYARALDAPAARAAGTTTLRIACIAGPPTVAGTVSAGGVTARFQCSALGLATVRLPRRVASGTLAVVSAVDPAGVLHRTTTKLR